MTLNKSFITTNPWQLAIVTSSSAVVNHTFLTYFYSNLKLEAPISIKNSEIQNLLQTSADLLTVDLNHAAAWRPVV